MTSPPNSGVSLENSLPKIIVGTSRIGSVLPSFFSSKTEKEKIFEYLDGILHLGCFAFDTAASYLLGGTERLLGQWMRSRSNRNRLFIISKGGHPIPVISPNRVTVAAITEDLHGSLKRLQTERIDLYMIHKDHPGAPLEPLLEMLTRFQAEGKIGSWGVSNWSHSRIAAINTLARAAELPTVVASSPHFSLLEWTKMPYVGSVSLAGKGNESERAYYEAHRLPVLAWSALGNGFFKSPAGGANAYANPTNFQRRERAEALAQKKGVSSAQIALAYLFHQKFPVFAIVSASTVKKMSTNVDAAKIELTESEVRWLETE